MLHNSLPIKKKVHMQNISHVPIRIDWIVYDIPEDMGDNPKLIELIPVIDNNPFDSFKSETTIMDNNDEIMSQTTISTSKEKRFPKDSDSVLLFLSRNKFSRKFENIRTFISQFN